MAKATGVVASQLQKDADLNGGKFNSRPYYRMFLGLICSLPANDPTDGSVFGMLTALSNTLAVVQVSQPFFTLPHDAQFMILVHAFYSSRYYQCTVLLTCVDE